MSAPLSLTLSEIEAAIEREIKQAGQSKNIARLAELQVIAGFLMQPADDAADKEASRRLRILAARAANAREELERKQER